MLEWTPTPISARDLGVLLQEQEDRPVVSIDGRCVPATLPSRRGCRTTSRRACAGGEERRLSVRRRPYSDYVMGHVSGALSVRLSSLMTRRLDKGRVKLHDLVIEEQKGAGCAAGEEGAARPTVAARSAVRGAVRPARGAGRGV